MFDLDALADLVPGLGKQSGFVSAESALGRAYQIVDWRIAGAHFRQNLLGGDASIHDPDALGFAAAVDVAVDMAEADLINQIIKEEQVVATVGEGEMTDGGAQSDSGAADKTAPAAQ